MQSLLTILMQITSEGWLGQWAKALRAAHKAWSGAEEDSDSSAQTDAVEPSPSKSVKSVGADEIVARAPPLHGGLHPVLPDQRPILPVRTSLQRWKVLPRAVLCNRDEEMPVPRPLPG